MVYHILLSLACWYSGSHIIVCTCFYIYRGVFVFLDSYVAMS